MELSDFDKDRAPKIARRRFDGHRANGTAQRYGYTNHTLQAELDYIGAEMIVCRVLGVPWRDAPTPAEDRGGDGTPYVQTRHTCHQNGRLLLHPDDDDWHRFFLAVGTFPRYEVVGWCMGWEGKREEFWKELQPGRPCFVVPRDALHAV